MTQNTAVAIRLVERGLVPDTLVPDTLVRQGIRRLLRERIVKLPELGKIEGTESSRSPEHRPSGQ